MKRIAILFLAGTLATSLMACQRPYKIVKIKRVDTVTKIVKPHRIIEKHTIRIFRKRHGRFILMRERTFTKILPSRCHHS